MTPWIRLEGEGPPLLLLHGAGGNADVWKPLLTHFRAFDVLALALPGRGGAPGPAVTSAREAALWVARQLDTLGGPPPIVLGHSWGGAVALELGLVRDVAGLVLVSTGAKLRVHPAILALAEQAVSGGPRSSSRPAFLPSASEGVVEAYLTAESSTPVESTLADWRGCDAFDARAQLAHIEVPALVVGGTEDVLTPPKYAAYLEAHLPRSAHVSIAAAGHMVPWEQPAPLASHVRAWASVTAQT
ncbi:MAG: alpha/beta fold hydrolase [Sandaracinaceae bacterium]